MTTRSDPALPHTPPLPRKPTPIWQTAISVTVTVIVIAAVWLVDINWSRLAALPSEIIRYIGLLFGSPNWSDLPEALRQTWNSVAMAWLGTVLGVLVSLPLSLIAARGIGPVWLRAPIRGLFALIRAVPEIIIAIVILSVTGLTPFTGALALAVGSVGQLGKWGFEAIESADTGPAEAARAAGGSLWQVVRTGVWPQVTSEYISFWLYRFEINVRASAVLGLIGVGGVGDMLTSYTQYRQWDTVGVLIIVVVTVTLAIDAFSSRLRSVLAKGA